jgi:hypothetical protein
MVNEVLEKNPQYIFKKSPRACFCSNRHKIYLLKALGSRAMFNKYVYHKYLQFFSYIRINELSSFLTLNQAPI